MNEMSNLSWECFICWLNKLICIYSEYSLESSDGFVDSLNFFWAEVLDISIFSFDNSVGVDVSLLNSNDSLSAMASLEAVSIILFSTFVKAFSVATEFGSNLLGSFLEIGSHGSNSHVVLLLSNLELLTSSL